MEWAFGTKVKMSLGWHLLHITVPRAKSWLCSCCQLPASIYPGRQQDRAGEALQPTWNTQIGFLVPGSYLDQAWLF